MSSAREDILANIRRSLGVSGNEADRRQTAEQRLAETPAGIIPRRGQVEGAERVLLFSEQAEGAHATVSQVARGADVPVEVTRFLRENNLPATLRLGEDGRLATLPWSATLLDIGHGPSEGHDLNAVSCAFAGVAETGTLVLTSGADNPTTLNFLPDNHIVVLFRRDLEADFESVWRKLRDAHGRARMPRTVNLVSGPSRSGDIEQKLLLGAHGPRRLHIVIVGED